MPAHAYPECGGHERLKPLVEPVLMCAWTAILQTRFAGKLQAVDAVLGTNRLF